MNIFARVKKTLLDVVLSRNETERFLRFRKKQSAAKNPLIRGYYTIRCVRICVRNNAFVPACAVIGDRVTFPHGLSGIYISQNAQIGSGCTIFHQVTIGSNALKSSRGFGAPVLGDNVFVGAGAKIIGNVHVGNNAKIGAGAVVVKDVPENATVVCAEPRIIPPPHSCPHIQH